MESMSLSEYQKKMELRNRQVNMAIAYLKRAKSAGIPEQHMRINQEEFEKILCPIYHGGKTGISKLASIIYRDPLSTMKYPFVIIDGGDIDARKRAGFAILFRLITCDNIGLYKDCGNLTHILEMNKPGFNINRNEFADELKTVNVLFISEFRRKLFNPHFQAGGFIDEVLNNRHDEGDVTIISFSSPLDNDKVANPQNVITTDECGQYMAMLSKTDITNKSNVLRIRVKT